MKRHRNRAEKLTNFEKSMAVVRNDPKNCCNKDLAPQRNQVELKISVKIVTTVVLPTIRMVSTMIMKNTALRILNKKPLLIPM